MSSSELVSYLCYPMDSFLYLCSQTKQIFYFVAWVFGRFAIFFRVLEFPELDFKIQLNFFSVLHINSIHGLFIVFIPQFHNHIWVFFSLWAFFFFVWVRCVFKFSQFTVIKFQPEPHSWQIFSKQNSQKTHHTIENLRHLQNS